MMRRLALATLLALLSACASGTPKTGTLSSKPSAPVDTLSAAARGLSACAAPSAAGADWREVAGPGFAFCVPPDWRPSVRREKLAAQSGAWRGRRGEWFQWGIGPFAKGKGEIGAVIANEVSEERATIAGREVRMTTMILPESYTTFALWKSTPTTQPLTVTTYARDDDGRALVRRIVGTVRFGDATPTTTR